MAMEQGAVVPVERKPRGVNWLYVTPMLAAPILPLCTWQAPLPYHDMPCTNPNLLTLQLIVSCLSVARLALRNHPRARAWVFGGLIAAFLTHGAWLITRSNAH